MANLSNIHVEVSSTERPRKCGILNVYARSVDDRGKLQEVARSCEWLLCQVLSAFFGFLARHSLPSIVVNAWAVLRVKNAMVALFAVALFVASLKS